MSLRFSFSTIIIAQVSSFQVNLPPSVDSVEARFQGQGFRFLRVCSTLMVWTLILQIWGGRCRIYYPEANDGLSGRRMDSRTLPLCSRCMCLTMLSDPSNTLAACSTLPLIDYRKGSLNPNCNLADRKSIHQEPIQAKPETMRPCCQPLYSSNGDVSEGNVQLVPARPIIA